MSQILHVQLVFLFTLLGISLSFLFAVFYYAVGLGFVASVILISAICSLLSLFYLKKKHNAELVAHLLLIELYIILIAANMHLGGFDNPNDVWFMVLPVIGGLLLKRNSVWLYSLIVLCTVLFFYVLKVYNYHIPVLLSHQELDIITLGNRVGAVIALAFLIILFRYERKITEHHLIRNEKELYKIANYDSLTKLPNRSFFAERFNARIASHREQESQLALLFIDLDGFKMINDTYGHNVGDELLFQVARRLESQLSEGDLLCRQGGDEFLIMPSPLNTEQGIEALADKIIKAVSVAFELSDQSAHIGCSIGIAYYPKHGRDYIQLLGASDVAMYQAKLHGSQQYQVFNKKTIKTTSDKSSLAIELRKAISNDELEIFYQAKYSIKEEKVVGYEALLRWTNNNGEVVSPSVFIAIAEEYSLSNQLGNWLLNNCCRQIVEWQSKGYDVPRIAVNISTQLLSKVGFVADLLAITDSYNLAAKSLELELTENVFIDYSSVTLKKLEVLNDLGFKLVIDDYGTGYASLGYLKRFPVSALKIDKSFIDELYESQQDRTIVQSTIKLAHQLGLQIIAEGVEDKQQYELLQDLDCDIVQGFYCAKPLPATLISLQKKQDFHMSSDTTS